MSDVAGVAKEIVRALDAVDEDAVRSHLPGQSANAHRSLVCGMNLELLTGLAEGLDAEDRLAPRLQPEPGRCCVRLKA